MAALPVQVVRGIYLGVLTGIIPALVAWSLGFVFKYVIGISVPAFGVVALGTALAGVNGGLLALTDPTFTANANAPTLMTALLVVMMLSFYAHNQGDELGGSLPRRLTFARLKERTLSADVVDLVGGFGHAKIEVVGVVEDMEGYPPLPEPLRARIRDVAWTFPADVSIGELESRFVDRLRTEFDVADASVSIDEKGRATVIAAPPQRGLSRHVRRGDRAVSVEALLPTGVARGDEVAVFSGEDEVRGTVVSVPRGDEDDEETDVPKTRAPMSPGGVGRLTVSVPRASARSLLETAEPRVVVRARGTRREFELLSLLRRRGVRIRRYEVAAGSALDGSTLGALDVRDTIGVAVLAVREPGGWRFGPRGDYALSAGADIFVAGSRDAHDAFTEVVT